MKTLYKLLVTGFLVLMLVLSGCVQEEGTENGGTENGMTEKGETENGETEKGETENGETENGETENGETENGGSTGEQMSFTTILISDAPTDNFIHINVTFSQVKVHKYGDDKDSGWILFDMEPKTIDMIYLHENNLSEELGVQNISVGNYSKLWIVVDSATGVLKETGEEITFDVPSGDLKIQQSFEIKKGNTTIDVELDLDRSVLYVPQGGVYKLRPQLGKMKINYDEDKGDEDGDEDEEELEADAGDEYEAEVNETIQFSGSAEGGIKPYNWSWDFGDGYNSTEQNPTHAYNTTGIYTVNLTVTDDIGHTATDTAIVYIYNELEANAGEEYEAEVNETIQFSGSAEGGIKPYNWSWDFGDGNSSTEQNPEHAYNATGTYTATLTVTDDEGNVATDTATVTIEEES
jgi:chitodextrinase